MSNYFNSKISKLYLKHISYFLGLLFVCVYLNQTALIALMSGAKKRQFQKCLCSFQNEMVNMIYCLHFYAYFLNNQS